MTKTLGTKEWACKNINFSTGCSNNCLYCYARRMAHRFGRKNWNDWANMNNRTELQNTRFKKNKGMIMTPSSHDLTPENVQLAKNVLMNLLLPGNNVLIVSKPNLQVIRELAHHLIKFRNQILWRFTIGTLDDHIREFWEPNAPPIQDRILVLKELFRNDWATSVSVEPFLDQNVIDLINTIDEYVTQTIWVGPMNRVHVPKEYWTEELSELYSTSNLFKIKREIDELENPKIRYKDHFLTTIKSMK